MIRVSSSVAPVVVNRKTSAALPRVSFSNYTEYLQTPWWRKRRNKALLAASWTCQRCPSRASLQVHHLSYANLGHEPAEDLEVLCRTCHEGEHVQQDQQRHAGIYFGLVRGVLQGDRFTRLADLFDAIRGACRTAKVPYDNDAVSAIVQALDCRGRGVLDAPAPVVMPALASRDERPIGREEAAALMRSLNITIGLREMPRAARLEAGAIEAFKRENGLWR